MPNKPLYYYYSITGTSNVSFFQVLDAMFCFETEVFQVQN